MKEFEKTALSWLDGDFDEETKKEILVLRESDPAGFEDAFYRNLEFGTGGLRGLMGVGTNRMNKYTVGMATQGLANYILSHVSGDHLSVCISYDSRNHSREFARIAADVLAANGIDVFIFDNIRPTPEMSYAVRKKGAVAGIMITASHNPKEYNGYKVSWSDGGQVTSPVDKEIVAEVAKITDPSMVKFSSDKPGTVSLMGREMDEAYLSDLISLSLSPDACARHSDIKIVYTPLHGCGVRLVPEILNRIGFQNIIHVPEQDFSDGDFPTVVSPNPEEPAALKMAIEKADETAADIVIGTDPDADRMGIAVRDNEGKMVLFNGNQTASMLTYYILNRWKELGKLGAGKYVVKTIVTTELITEICRKFDVPVYNVLTGFKYIAEVVKRKQAEGCEFICGGEESYGFNVGEFVRDKDAQVSCMMVAECAAWAADQGLTLYQLMQKIYTEFGYRKEGLVSLVRKGISGAQEIRQIMVDLRANPPAQLCGSKVTKVIDYLEPEKTGQPSSNVLQFFDEAGDVVSVRPSGTEPKIKFYFGAKGDDADEKIAKLKEQLVS